MELKDIKTGMLVLTSDDKLRIVIGDTMISYSGGGGLSLNLYNDDLSLKDIYKNEDREIIKVYSEPYSHSGLCADLEFWLDEKEFEEYSNLLYVKETVQEMTIEEIENELGRKIGKYNYG